MNPLFLFVARVDFVKGTVRVMHRYCDFDRTISLTDLARASAAEEFATDYRRLYAEARHELRKKGHEAVEGYGREVTVRRLAKK